MGVGWSAMEPGNSGRLRWLRWQAHPPRKLSFLCTCKYAQLYFKCGSLPEPAQRSTSAKGPNSDCRFWGSFLLGSLLHALASERGWARHCLTNKWLVSSLPGETEKQLTFSVLKRNGLCYCACFLASWLVKYLQRHIMQSVGPLPFRLGLTLCGPRVLLVSTAFLQHLLSCCSKMSATFQFLLQ